MRTRFIKITAVLLFVLIVTLFLYAGMEGLYLFHSPAPEDIQSVVITHADFPNQPKHVTDGYYISLAEAMLGYLRYVPFKKPTDGVPLIEMTFVLKDGAELSLQANEQTVWWMGKPYALRERGLFIKMCTAVFYIQRS